MASNLLAMASKLTGDQRIGKADCRSGLSKDQVISGLILLTRIMNCRGWYFL